MDKATVDPLHLVESLDDRSNIPNVHIRIW